MSGMHLFNNVKNNKTWCPYCANNRPCTLEDAKQLAYNRKGACLSEYYINNVQLYYGCVIKSIECSTGLELNIYYPEYGFAIEVQAVQHEKYIKFFHNGDPNNFIKQQARDQLKKELCEKNQIALRRRMILLQFG
ncbi:putative nuclease [Rhizophagus clarus]|uniref:Putative nuclease n=1 Tax=Rhizophagus clarus TaxID=94130 RepID=A0A8H3QFN5_9GLOM|nr:putative nuclease [Rhizophagus clarus]